MTAAPRRPRLSFDGLRALVPVRIVQRVDPDEPPSYQGQVTAARYGYPRGYQFNAWGHWVVVKTRTSNGVVFCRTATPHELGQLST